MKFMIRAFWFPDVTKSFETLLLCSLVPSLEGFRFFLYKIRLKDRLGPYHSEFILPVRQSENRTIVLKIMGNHSKVILGRYIIKSGFENVICCVENRQQ